MIRFPDRRSTVEHSDQKLVLLVRLAMVAVSRKESSWPIEIRKRNRLDRSVAFHLAIADCFGTFAECCSHLATKFSSMDSQYQCQV
jgi:hypothetical protein